MLKSLPHRYSTLRLSSSIFSQPMTHIWTHTHKKNSGTATCLYYYYHPSFHCYLTGKTNPRKPRDKDRGGTTSRAKAHRKKWQPDQITNCGKQEARTLKTGDQVKGTGEHNKQDGDAGKKTWNHAKSRWVLGKMCREKTNTLYKMIDSKHVSWGSLTNGFRAMNWLIFNWTIQRRIGRTSGTVKFNWYESWSNCEWMYK